MDANKTKTKQNKHPGKILYFLDIHLFFPQVYIPSHANGLSLEENTS